MNRTNNIKLGKASDKIIISELEKLTGFICIDEIKDSQQNRYNIKGLDKFYNDINSKLGVDYILTMHTLEGYQTYYLDTKGFNYNPRYNGKLNTDGIVETMLLQVEKYYSGISRKGWANSPEHWTTNTLILINNHIYFISYPKLIEYCNKLEQVADIPTISFPKGYGNYERCIIANVNDMLEQGVIKQIRPVSIDNIIKVA